jgi:hypothetical protein
LGGLAAVAPIAGQLATAEGKWLGPPVTGRVVLPSDREYDTARFDYNKRFDVFPRAIAYCRSTLDVSNAVRWARARNLPRTAWRSIRRQGSSWRSPASGSWISTEHCP